MLKEAITFTDAVYDVHKASGQTRFNSCSETHFDTFVSFSSGFRSLRLSLKESVR